MQMVDIQSIDEEIIRFFNNDLRIDFLDWLLPLFSETRNLIIALICFAFFYVWYCEKHGLKPWVKIGAFIFLAGIGLGINNTVTEIIKAIANRTRPYHGLENIFYQEQGQWFITTANTVLNGGGTSFLSGHSSNTMVVACAFMWVFAKNHYYIYILPLFVGWSRMYLGKHYLSDVIAGWLLGFIVVLLVYKLLLKYFPKYYGV